MTIKLPVKETLLVAGFIILVTFLVFSKIKGSSPETPEISIIPQEFDFGQIKINEGIKETKSTLKNEGGSNLVLNKIFTSCMCTEAQILDDDYISPRFGMPGHDTNPVDWSYSVKPRSQATLKIYFDPSAHGPQGIGSFERIIIIQSNDPLKPEVRIKIRGEVIE